jgi:hypothetical protein
MNQKEMEALARRAGYVLGMMIVPKRCYTITDLVTRKKYRMKMSKRDLIKILERDVITRKVVW